MGKIVNIIIIDALAANEGRRKFSRDAIGVGPRLLAGVCLKNGINSKIARVEDILENKAKVKLIDYDCALISGMSVDKIAIERVINKIKNENNKMKLILGGPVLAEPEFLFKNEIDIGVAGEGEKILNDLIINDFSHDSFLEGKNKDEYFWVEEKKSFLVEQKKTDRTNIFHEFFPSTKHITDYPDYWFSKVYVEVVRGCSNHYRGDIVRELGNCSNCGNCDSLDDIKHGDCPEDIPPGCGFCSVSETFGAPLSRDIELISKEIRELFEEGVRKIILSAPGFLDFKRSLNDKPIFSPTYPPANEEKIKELLTELTEIRDEQELRCSIAIENVKPSLVTPTIARTIGDALPDTPISIGCETFDENHSRKIGRPSAAVKAIEAAKMFTKNNIHPQIYLIHSLPGESVQSLDITRNVIEEELDEIAEKITMYKYLPLPGSPFSVTGAKLSHDRYLMKLKREELKKSIINFNLKKKQELIGKVMEAIVAEKDAGRENTYICYPIYSGPAISIDSEINLVGKDVRLKIIDIISDKLVKGEKIE